MRAFQRSRLNVPSEFWEWCCGPTRMMKTRLPLARAWVSVLTIDSGEGASFVPEKSFPKALGGSFGGPNGIPRPGGVREEPGGPGETVVASLAHDAEAAFADGSSMILAAEVVAPMTTTATSTKKTTDRHLPARERAARIKRGPPYSIDVHSRLESSPPQFPSGIDHRPALPLRVAPSRILQPDSANCKVYLEAVNVSR